MLVISLRPERQNIWWNHAELCKMSTSVFNKKVVTIDINSKRLEDFTKCITQPRQARTALLAKRRKTLNHQSYFPLRIYRKASPARAIPNNKSTRDTTTSSLPCQSDVPLSARSVIPGGRLLGGGSDPFENERRRNDEVREASFTKDPFPSTFL
ncbi:hypothetical protein Trydic_g3839 [Trypoxylus dichotomus]